MRILYYSSHPHLHLDAQTGYGTHMREMIQAFRDAGNIVETRIGGNSTNTPTQISGEKSANKKASLKKIIPSLLWESLKDLRLSAYDSKEGKELRRIVNDFEPDIIYERTAYLQNSGILVAKELGIRHISEINAPFPEERAYFAGSSLLINKSKKVEQEIIEKSDCICVVSSSLQKYILNISPRAKSKVKVIPNGVNPGVKITDKLLINDLRDKYDLKNKTIIGFVGSIFPYHGVDILIEAFANLTDKNLRLLIVGDGESISELKVRVVELNQSDRVIFTGSVSHQSVFNYIELMDICCMVKSNWYGSPVKIFEYGLMKKVVIAPDVVPVRDVMEDGEDGILVQENIQSISESLRSLVADDALRAKLANNWNQKVLSRHTWKVLASKTLEQCT